MIHVLFRGESLRALGGKLAPVPAGRWLSRSGITTSPAAGALGMWESRRDFQEEWEGWKAGILETPGSCCVSITTVDRFDSPSVTGSGFPRMVTVVDTAGVRFVVCARTDIEQAMIPGRSITRARERKSCEYSPAIFICYVHLRNLFEGYKRVSLRLVRLAQ
jgi:hypothetical protein